MSEERPDGPEDPGLPPDPDESGSATGSETDSSAGGGAGSDAGVPAPAPAPASAAPGFEPPPAPPAGGRPGLPWEHPTEGRSISSALETLRLVLLQPADAFARMRVDGSLGDPLLFLLLFGTIGAFFGLLWQNTMRTMFGRIADADLAEIAAVNAFGVVSLLMAPVFVLLFAALAALLIHVALMALGGAPRPLDVTLRTVCYASGGTHLLTIIPLCGGIISLVWWIVVLSIGIREAQEVPGGRAVAAVLAPIVLICCCCAALGFTFGAAILSMAGLAQ